MPFANLRRELRFNQRRFEESPAGAEPIPQLSYARGLETNVRIWPASEMHNQKEHPIDWPAAAAAGSSARAPANINLLVAYKGHLSEVTVAKH